MKLLRELFETSGRRLDCVNLIEDVLNEGAKWEKGSISKRTYRIPLGANSSRMNPADDDGEWEEERQLAKDAAVNYLSMFRSIKVPPFFCAESGETFEDLLDAVEKEWDVAEDGYHELAVICAKKI